MSNSPILAYHAIPRAARTAAFLLRGWAVANWFGTLLAATFITAAVYWQRFPLFSPGDSWPGILLYFIAGTVALFCIGWGILCWSLGNAAAAADARCARIAMTLNIVMAIGCGTTIAGLYFLRHSFGPLHWTGTEGTAWRALLAFATPFITACTLTFLILRRVLTFENRPRSV